MWVCGRGDVVVGRESWMGWSCGEVIFSGWGEIPDELCMILVSYAGYWDGVFGVVDMMPLSTWFET